jgi:hypothetical protein
LLVATIASACTAWHTTSLQPQRFSAEESPERVRITFTDGKQLTARHPVMVGDSLVWMARSGKSPRDSTRSAVLVSSIRRIKVHEVDTGLTIALLAFLGGAAALSVVAVNGIAAGQ